MPKEMVGGAEHYSLACPSHSSFSCTGAVSGSPLHSHETNFTISFPSCCINYNATSITAAFGECHTARMAYHVYEFDTLTRWSFRRPGWRWWISCIPFSFTVLDYILAQLASRERICFRGLAILQ
jgi:hypothetical protein